MDSVPKIWAHSADMGATMPPANGFTGRDDLGVDKAAVNAGQGMPSRHCLLGSGMAQRKGSFPLPTTQE